LAEKQPRSVSLDAQQKAGKNDENNDKIGRFDAQIRPPERFHNSRALPGSAKGAFFFHPG
jgi:hypothetical protein